MLRRGLIVSGLGLSLSLAGAGLVNSLPALAQETETSSADAAVEVDHEAELQAHYEDFLARLTENLGLSDPELVETAFKDTMKEMIDAQFEAGEISANLADELKTRIDEADGPFLFGGHVGGEMRVRAFGPDGRGPGRGIFHDGGMREGRHKIIIGEEDGLPALGGEASAPAAPAAPGETESLPATDEPVSTPST